VRLFLFTTALLALIASNANAGADREVTLVLPHAPQAGETVWLELEVGEIQRGEEINVMTGSGQFLGTVSPFGVRPGQKAGTYVVPLPNGAVKGDRVSLRLSLEHNHVSRAPTPKELMRARVKFGPQAQ